MNPFRRNQVTAPSFQTTIVSLDTGASQRKALWLKLSTVQQALHHHAYNIFNIDEHRQVYALSLQIKDHKLDAHYSGCAPFFAIQGMHKGDTTPYIFLHLQPFSVVPNYPELMQVGLSSLRTITYNDITKSHIFQVKAQNFAMYENLETCFGIIAGTMIESFSQDDLKSPSKLHFLPLFIHSINNTPIFEDGFLDEGLAIMPNVLSQSNLVNNNNNKSVDNNGDSKSIPANGDNKSDNKCIPDSDNKGDNKNIPESDKKSDNKSDNKGDNQPNEFKQKPIVFSPETLKSVNILSKQLEKRDIDFEYTNMIRSLSTIKQSVMFVKHLILVAESNPAVLHQSTFPRLEYFLLNMLLLKSNVYIADDERMTLITKLREQTLVAVLNRFVREIPKFSASSLSEALTREELTHAILNQTPSLIRKMRYWAYLMQSTLQMLSYSTTQLVLKCKEWETSILNLKKDLFQCGDLLVLMKLISPTLSRNVTLQSVAGVILMVANPPCLKTSKIDKIDNVVDKNEIHKRYAIIDFDEDSSLKYQSILETQIRINQQLRLDAKERFDLALKPISLNSLDSRPIDSSLDTKKEIGSAIGSNTVIAKDEKVNDNKTFRVDAADLTDAQLQILADQLTISIDKSKNNVRPLAEIFMTHAAAGQQYNLNALRGIELTLRANAQGMCQRRYHRLIVRVAPANSRVSLHYLPLAVRHRGKRKTNPQWLLNLVRNCKEQETNPNAVFFDNKKTEKTEKSQDNQISDSDLNRGVQMQLKSIKPSILALNEILHDECAICMRSYLERQRKALMDIHLNLNLALKNNMGITLKHMVCVECYVELKKKDKPECPFCRAAL